MILSRHDQDPADCSPLESQLKEQFDRLRAEPVPERLVQLARELQDRLRARTREVEPGEQ